MTRALIVQKLWGFGLVALAIAVLTPEQIGIAFAVFGQGHFLAAYFYQWKAGKIGGRWLSIYAVCASTLFATAIMTNAVEWFALVTSLVFIIHHFQDEASLFGEERSLMRTLEQIQPVLLYGAFLVQPLLGTVVSYTCVALFGIALCTYVVYIARGHRPDMFSGYLLAITAVLFGLWLCGVDVPSRTLMGSVILFHYVCWYVYYYYRFAQNLERQRTYVRDMLGINALVLGAYALFAFGVPGADALGYLFLPIFFYIWTLLHIGSSVRVNDYRAILR